MTNNQLNFLNLISDALNNRMSFDTVVFSDVYSLACEQGLSRIILPALKKYRDKGKLVDESNSFDKEFIKLSAQIVTYTKKQYAVSRVIDEMTKNGIECIMLKGDTLASLYPERDVRMSGDTDLLIDPKKERKCLKLFKKMGCYVKKRTATNNQSVIVHPHGGKFEIHVSLDTKQVTENWYGNLKLMSEPLRSIKVAGLYEYKTLGYTDTAVNLVLHFIRHFVGGIANIRMMLDTVLFINKNYDKIDFEKTETIMEKLKFDKIYESLKYIGGVYFNLSDIKYNDEFKNSADKILDDIFECGNYGFDKMEQQNYTYSVYSQKRFSRFSKGNYSLYQKKILILDTYDLIFKDKYEMMKLYPALEKRMFLLPFMYIHRAFSCVFNTLTKRKTKVENKSNGENIMLQKRLELIDELDMI